MPPANWMYYVPVLALLIWAAIEDARARRIPNWITFSLALAGLANAFLTGQPLGPTAAMLGFLTGFGLGFVLFGLNAVGAGDVKILAAMGAWLGPLGAVKLFALEAIIGMVIVLVQAAIQRRTRTLWRNTAVLAINLVHLQELGVDHVSETGKSCQSVKLRLPYAVPVLVAAAILLLTA